MTQELEQETPTPPSEKVWGNVRLTCGCWWSWKADSQADYLFPRDPFTCHNLDDEGTEHGVQTIVSVRMFSHAFAREQAILRKAHKKAVKRHDTDKEARRIAHEARVAADQEAGQARLAEVAAALERGEEPVTTRGERRRLREAGLNV